MTQSIPKAASGRPQLANSLGVEQVLWSLKRGQRRGAFSTITTLMTVAFAIIVAFPLLVATVSAQILHKRSNTTFFDPTQNNGSFFDVAGPGVGEPLNVIISGTSSTDVLTDDGFLNYARAIGFSAECLDMHHGAPQTANLGDGNGQQNQTVELREDFGDATFGTCIEQIIGGNHIRVYRQNGSLANTGALFLAVSSELGLLENHTISLDGYNRGRDGLAQGAAGTKSFNGTTYSTAVQNLTGVMPAGSQGVNHNISVDGNAVLLTVTIM